MNTSDLDLERLLRAGDPLPAPDALAAETSAAMTLTREALVQRSGRGAATSLAAFAIVPAPWGPLHVAASADGIVAIELRSTTPEFVDGLALRLRGRVVPEEAAEVPAAARRHLATAREQLADYFAGARSTFDLPVDLRGISEWDRRVLTGAARLDFGETTSYGELARRIGKPGAARAVGGALGRNPVPIVIPCHRILAADGTIGGYGGGGHGSRIEMLAVKRSLLSLEGCAIGG